MSHELSDDEDRRLLEQLLDKYGSTRRLSKRTSEVWKAMKASGAKPRARGLSYPIDDGVVRLADVLQRMNRGEGRKLSKQAALRLVVRLLGSRRGELGDEKLAVNRLRNKPQRPWPTRPNPMMMLFFHDEEAAAAAMFRAFHKRRPDLGLLPTKLPNSASATLAKNYQQVRAPIWRYNGG